MGNFSDRHHCQKVCVYGGTDGRRGGAACCRGSFACENHGIQRATTRNLIRSEKKMCEECYSDENRITPLLNPLDCLENHTQYICGTCGRCICIEHDPNRGLQRWDFPFKSLEIAKLYLRSADYSKKKSCGIYELKSENGRLSYKIFADNKDLLLYLKKNKGKTCKNMKPVFIIEEYKEYANTQVRKLTSEEIQKYMSER